MTAYKTILLFLLVTSCIALILVSYSWFYQKRYNQNSTKKLNRKTIKKPSSAKYLTYECGFDANEILSTKTDSFSYKPHFFNIHFYKTAILFIMFDIEIIVLVPWVCNIEQMTTLSNACVFLFLTILGIGFIYELKTGTFEWRQKTL